MLPLPLFQMANRSCISTDFMGCNASATPPFFCVEVSWPFQPNLAAMTASPSFVANDESQLHQYRFHGM
jgi:hypothetical protein